MRIRVIVGIPPDPSILLLVYVSFQLAFDFSKRHRNVVSTEVIARVLWVGSSAKSVQLRVWTMLSNFSEEALCEKVLEIAVNQISALGGICLIVVEERFLES